AATTASVWLTTADRGNLLRQQGNVTFGSGGSGSVITVNPNAAYQSMVGFGASFTDAAAWNVFNSSQRTNIMNALFNPGSGIGLSFLRQPIGSTDFSRSFYTYDDGGSDPSLSRFSIAHDNSYILPLVTQARSLNPKLSIMATPWSAPAWMKNNNNLVGGSLNDSQIGVYADYLVKFAQAYGNAGAPIAYMSVQNEPNFSPPAYPGMKMSASQQVNIINNLAPKLRAAGLNTKILGYDHNWDDTNFPQQVNNGAGGNVAGSAWHCYGGNPSGQSVVHNAQPSKDIFFTECSGTSSGDDASTFRDSLRWQGINLAIGATRNWAKSVSIWNMALDNNHGPVIGSCTNCMGVATVSGGSVSYNAEYYVLGHLSKFVQPGAVRIDSTGYGDGGIQNVAFLVGLAFAFAGSANLSTLLYSLFWKRFNTPGTLWGMYGGLVSCLVLVFLSPVVSGSETSIFPGMDFAVFPLSNPGIVSIPLSFVAGFLGTVLSRDRGDERKQAEMEVRSLTGISG
ncbi:hypothetical protein ACFQ1S_16495, partial [Kibdelosporangium lantanae]